MRSASSLLLLLVVASPASSASQVAVAEAEATFTSVSTDANASVATKAAIPAVATDCTTVEELKQWRDKEQKKLKASVPVEFQNYSKSAIDQEYQQQLAKLQLTNGGGAVAAAPRHAKDCRTKAELEQWRQVQEDRLKAHIPAFAQGMALAPVEQAYRDRLVELEKNKTAHAAGDAATSFFAAQGPSSEHTTSSVTSAFPAADYQKYMDVRKYVNGGEAQGAASSKTEGGYQTYMDFRKYMMEGSSLGIRNGSSSFAAAPAGGAGAGSDYQKYLDYSKYMKGESSTGSSYQKYMDYRQKYMQSSGASAPSPESASGGSTSNDGGSNFFTFGGVDDLTNKSYRELISRAPQDVDKAASGVGTNYQAFVDYQKYMDWEQQLKQLRRQANSSAPLTASACKTEKELAAWRGTLENSTKANVPASFRKYAEVPLDEEYRRNLARLRNTAAATLVRVEKPKDVSKALKSGEAKQSGDSSAFSAAVVAAVLPASATDCKTKAELKQWRHRQETLVNATVPDFVQSLVLFHVQKEYEESLARLQAKKAADQEDAAQAENKQKGEETSRNNTAKAKDDTSDSDDVAGRPPRREGRKQSEGEGEVEAKAKAKAEAEAEVQNEVGEGYGDDSTKKDLAKVAASANSKDGSQVSNSSNAASTQLAEEQQEQKQQSTFQVALSLAVTGSLAATALLAMIHGKSRRNRGQLIEEEGVSDAPFLRLDGAV